ncbi:MAG TPA: SRPBCC family protein [Acidimicrobiia bacterium]|nr:SRPBCC family protein [Acidimicrobiia bacterium]
MELGASRDIARPAGEVFGFVADSSNNPLWQKGQTSCIWTSPPPIGVGSTYDQEARFLGRTVRNTFEVVEFDPGHSITIRSIAGTFPITVRRTVEELGPTSSRVTAEIRGEPGSVFRVAGPLLRRMAQRSVDADYDRLQRLLDSKQIG